MDFGYPKRITDGWPGASASIDAAVSLKNGTIFLFQKTGVLTFNPPLCKEEKSFISNIKDSSKSKLRSYFKFKKFDSFDYAT